MGKLEGKVAVIPQRQKSVVRGIWVGEMGGISEGVLNFLVGGYWAACAAARMRAWKSG
jgi:hypothetical protein